MLQKKGYPLALYVFAYGTASRKGAALDSYYANFHEAEGSSRYREAADILFSSHAVLDPHELRQYSIDNSVEDDISALEDKQTGWADQLTSFNRLFIKSSSNRKALKFLLARFMNGHFYPELGQSSFGFIMSTVFNSPGIDLSTHVDCLLVLASIILINSDRMPKEFSNTSHMACAQFLLSDPVAALLFKQCFEMKNLFFQFCFMIRENVSADYPYKDVICRELLLLAADHSVFDANACLYVGYCYSSGLHEFSQDMERGTHYLKRVLPSLDKGMRMVVHLGFLGAPCQMSQAIQFLGTLEGARWAHSLDVENVEPVGEDKSDSCALVKAFKFFQNQNQTEEMLAPLEKIFKHTGVIPLVHGLAYCRSDPKTAVDCFMRSAHEGNVHARYMVAKLMLIVFGENRPEITRVVLEEDSCRDQVVKALVGQSVVKESISSYSERPTTPSLIPLLAKWIVQLSGKEGAIVDPQHEPSQVIDGAFFALYMAENNLSKATALREFFSISHAEDVLDVIEILLEGRLFPTTTRHVIYYLNKVAINNPIARKVLNAVRFPKLPTEGQLSERESKLIEKMKKDSVLVKRLSREAEEDAISQHTKSESGEYKPILLESKIGSKWMVTMKAAADAKCLIDDAMHRVLIAAKAGHGEALLLLSCLEQPEKVVAIKNFTQGFLFKKLEKFRKNMNAITEIACRIPSVSPAMDMRETKEDKSSGEEGVIIFQRVKEQCQAGENEEAYRSLMLACAMGNNDAQEVFAYMTGTKKLPVQFDSGLRPYRACDILPLYKALFPSMLDPNQELALSMSDDEISHLCHAMSVYQLIPVVGSMEFDKAKEFKHGDYRNIDCLMSSMKKGYTPAKMELAKSINRGWLTFNLMLDACVDGDDEALAWFELLKSHAKKEDISHSKYVHDHRFKAMIEDLNVQAALNRLNNKKTTLTKLQDAAKRNIQTEIDVYIQDDAKAWFETTIKPDDAKVAEIDNALRTVYAFRGMMGVSDELLKGLKIFNLNVMSECKTGSVEETVENWDKVYQCVLCLKGFLVKKSKEITSQFDSISKTVFLDQRSRLWNKSHFSAMLALNKLEPLALTKKKWIKPFTLGRDLFITPKSEDKLRKMQVVEVKCPSVLSEVKENMPMVVLACRNNEASLRFFSKMDSHLMLIRALKECAIDVPLEFKSDPLGENDWRLIRTVFMNKNAETFIQKLELFGLLNYVFGGRAISLISYLKKRAADIDAAGQEDKERIFNAMLIAMFMPAEGETRKGEKNPIMQGIKDTIAQHRLPIKLFYFDIKDRRLREDVEAEIREMAHAWVKDEKEGKAMPYLDLAEEEKMKVGAGR